ncbi:MAG TPA: alpha-amylase family glycosyl hydrolase [Flavisolibacter sp.]
MKRLLLLVAATLCSLFSFAQLLTWTPAFPKETDPITITVDATKGNQGLLNHTPTDVYIHTGVITNLSTSQTAWRYVKFNQNFNQPNAQLQATYLGNNKWQFTIPGSIRAFYDVPAGETILKIALLFRSGDGLKKQANATDNGDMYIPVYTTDLAVRLSQPFREPRYTPTPEPQAWNIGTNFPVSAEANKASAMKLYHNGTVIATSAGNVTNLSGNSAVTGYGNQQIVAEANDGTTTKYDTINVFVAPPSAPVAPLPAGVRDGINYHSGTSATLVLRAPLKNIITVMGEFNNWQQAIMNKTADGKFFWITLNGLTPGTEYAFQYVIDGTIKIADPYAEKILDPYNNNDQNIPAATYPNLKSYPQGQTGIVSVLQTQAPGYNWVVNNFTRPDKKGLVIYELLVRDFVAAHDWKTLRDSLNYLKNLGINAIEIMPFNEFEGNESWGYNPDFYFAPDKYYGPKNSLKEFIDSCHKKGIAVIMDIALNHSFGLAPMVQMYWDPVANRPAADNPWFNQVAKHDFNVGFDMNHESLDTRYFVSRVAEHWLQEYKIDGFRFDLSKGFTQVQTCDNNGQNCNSNAMANYDPSRVAIWKRYYDTTQTKSANSYVILEHFANNTEEIELSNYGMLLWGNMHGAYTEAAKGNINNSDFSGAIHTDRSWTKPHLVSYMESHDEDVLFTKASRKGLFFRDIISGTQQLP